MDEIRCAIELRADDSRESPGRIVGTLVTYGERASDRPELFEAGSLTWPDGGVVLNRQHTRTSGGQVCSHGGRLKSWDRSETTRF